LQLQQTTATHYSDSFP